MSSLNDRMATDSYPVRGCHHVNRIRHVLTMTDFPDHLNKIENCAPGRYCNTPYCPACRERHVRTHIGRLLALYRELHNSNEDRARENIRFVTVLHELCRPDIKEVRAGLSRGKMALAALRRSFPGLYTHGRFELEAVDTEAIFNSGTCPQKSVALQDLNGGRLIAPNRDMILFHSHFLLFLNGNDIEQVKDKLAIRFPGRYRIKVDSLFKDRSVEESIRKIGSYILKDRYFYNNHMKADGYVKGTYLRDESLSFLIRSYMSDGIGIDDCLIYSKKR